MSAAPWSVKGIDPKAREVAKDLARRSGMTLGEWLNTMIMEDSEDDDAVIPMSRRTHASDAFERRGRSRRLDDVYGGSEDTLHRVAASVEAIAARLEAAERRSTVAIQGVDQAVTGLVRRLDGQEAVGRTYGRRLDDISEELREGHRRLRTFEQETGPQTVETLGKVETGLGALASRLYDIEERQRTSFNELRQRMESAEKTAGPGQGSTAMAQAAQRLDQAQAQTTAALRGLERSFAGLDQRLRAAEGRVEPEGARETARFEKLAETLTRQVEANRTDMMRRLDTAEQENRLSRIETAISAAQDQVRAAEKRSALSIETMGREVLRIAQNLNNRVVAVDARLDRAEVTNAETLSAAGQTIATELNRSLSEKLDRDIARHGQIIDQRLTRAEDQQALAIEKLGNEITRISDRLSDRIAQSERKSAQALDDVARRLSDSSERIEQAYGRSTGELGERLRLSEQRTADLIAEARETMERRATQGDAGSSIEARTQAPVAQRPADTAATSEGGTASGLDQADWRSAAFPDESFDNDDLWAVPTGFKASDAPAMVRDNGGLAPFPAFDDIDDSDLQGRALAETNPVDRLIADMTADWDADRTAPEAASTSPTAGFGGADVSDALSATAAFATQAPAFTGTAFAGPSASGPAASGPSATGFDPLDADILFTPEPDGFDLHGSGPLAPQGPSIQASSNQGPASSDLDEFGTESPFVDAQALRAGLSAGAANARSDATRGTLEAARAAMATSSVDDTPARGAFGLKRGGKSRLQERLDKQAQRDTSTVRKTILASVTATALVCGAYVTGRVTGLDAFTLPAVDQALGLGTPVGPSGSTDGATADGADATLAAVALTGPSPASPEAQALFETGLSRLDAGDKSGLEPLTQAANLGMAEAQLKLADLYQSGTGGAPRNLTEARTWARRAAETGDARGMHAYGMYLFGAVGGPANKSEGLTWLTKAADRGLVDSQFNVAKIYETGDQGIAANPADALKWYLIAAKAGDQQARAAADRLATKVPATGRQAARDAANAFAVEPTS